MEADNILLKNQQVTEEIKKEIKICIETNENENTTTQNLWDTVKAVLRAKFIATKIFFKCSMHVNLYETDYAFRIQFMCHKNGPDSLLESCAFLRICPFLPRCPFYWHI